MSKFLTVFFIITIGYSSICFAQSQLDSCILKLHSADYLDVYKAKHVIISKYQNEAIPKLILMLKDTGYAKLFNTMDLIYPGATKFYGHGGVINYDIDWLSVRAGWILEELTFMNFGYSSQSPIDDKNLMTIHNQDYQSYLKKGYHEVNFSDTTLSARLIRSRLYLAFVAEKWWTLNKNNWSILNGLTSALSSKDEYRENLAIQYLRFGGDFVDEAERRVRSANYPHVIKLVRKIKASRSNNSQQAKYLLEQMDYLKQKYK